MRQTSMVWQGPAGISREAAVDRALPRG